MPYLSDIGRETAEKAERLFAFINSRFLGEVAMPHNELLPKFGDGRNQAAA
jgi:hypothetical protein